MNALELICHWKYPSYLLQCIAYDLGDLCSDLAKPYPISEYHQELRCYVLCVYSRRDHTNRWDWELSLYFVVFRLT